jgi:hypothetical protein
MSGPLPATTSWTDVIVPRVGDDEYVYRIPFDTYAAAQIEYGVFDEDNKPLKIGVLTLPTPMVKQNPA